MSTKNNRQPGRPKTPIPDNFSKIVVSLKNKKIDIETALYISGMSRATFYRKIKEFNITDDKQCANCFHGHKIITEDNNTLYLCTLQNKVILKNMWDSCDSWKVKEKI